MGVQSIVMDTLHTCAYVYARQGNDTYCASHVCANNNYVHVKKLVCVCVCVCVRKYDCVYLQSCV